MNAATDGAALSARPLTPIIGSQVRCDVDTLLSGRFAGEIRDLLERRGVLVFPRLGLTTEQQLAFTQTLGEPLLQGGRRTMNVSLDKADHDGKERLAEYLHGTVFWHIDQTTENTLCRASLLTARRTSATGGQTEFANTYAAWEALPEPEKRAYENLRVVHSVEISQRYFKPEPRLHELLDQRRFPPKVHPLVWTHRSGRKSLVLGSTADYVEGLSLNESRYVLTKLRGWATQPRFVYRHEWAVGDLVMWDNTGVMHRVRPYADDSGRLMTRTTLVGEEALA